MAVFTFSFCSKSLNSYVPVNIILPIGMEYEDMVQPGEKFQTLWLLHGYGGNCMEWSDRTALGAHAMHHKFAVVMPGGDNSFYRNTGLDNEYLTFITEELPAFCRKYFPLSDKREDNFIAGISMGGFGTAKIAFNFPEKYAAAGIFAFGPGDPTMLMQAENFGEGRSEMMKGIFKDPESVAGTPDDLWNIIRKDVETGVDLPAIYNACGTEDFIYPTFVQFCEFAESIGLKQKTTALPGVHGWEVWNKFLDEFVDWLPLKNRNFWMRWYEREHADD